MPEGLAWPKSTPAAALPVSGPRRGRKQGCRFVQELAKGNRLAVVQEGDDGLPGLDDPAGQNLLGLGQVHGRPVPDVVAAPCLPAEEDVFPDRQDNEICLLSDLDGLLNHLLVVLQGGEINLVDERQLE